MIKKILAIAIVAVMVSGLAVFAASAANVMRGDVNGDGVINAPDATLLRRFLANPGGSGLQNFNHDNADANADGTIDNADLEMIRNYIASRDPENFRFGGAPLIAITFDDGPTFFGGDPWGNDANGYTERLLNYISVLNNRSEVLSGDRAPIHVTFYIDGDGLAFGMNERRLVQRMAAEGHAVDNHTWGHPNLSSMSGPAVRAQIMQVENTLILPYAGQASFSFRPTFFSHNPQPYPAGMIGLDRQLNLPFIFAGIDPDDWRANHSAAAMTTFIVYGTVPRGTLCSCPAGCAFEGASMPDGTPFVGIRGNNGRGGHGGNILFHDGGGHSRQRTLDTFNAIIPILEELGYEMVTVEEMYRRMGLQPCWYFGQRVNDWASPCTHTPPCYQLQPLLNRDGTYFLDRLNQ